MSSGKKMLMRCVTPASMSKAMTLYLVFEAMSKGEISEDTVITATPNRPSYCRYLRNFKQQDCCGVDYTVSELITMTAVPSSKRYNRDASQTT